VGAYALGPARTLGGQSIYIIIFIFMVIARTDRHDLPPTNQPAKVTVPSSKLGNQADRQTEKG